MHKGLVSHVSANLMRIYIELLIVTNSHASHFAHNYIHIPKQARSQAWTNEGIAQVARV
jgi:hypothetical protein